MTAAIVLRALTVLLQIFFAIFSGIVVIIFLGIDFLPASTRHGLIQSVKYSIKQSFR